jgi:hypothetical protein
MGAALHDLEERLRGAEQEAIRGVLASTNKLRADADADILNMASKAGRYTAPGSRVTNDIHSAAERTHLDLFKKEADRIGSLVAGYRVEHERETRPINGVESAS